MTKTTQPLAPGDRRTWTNEAGRVTVVMQRTDAGQTWTITTTQGGTYRLDEWCDTYGTPSEAQAAYDYVKAVFGANDTEQALDAHRAHLIAELDTQRRRLARRLPEAKTLLEQHLAEQDALESLATRRLSPKFVADVTAFLAA